MISQSQGEIETHELNSQQALFWTQWLSLNSQMLQKHTTLDLVNNPGAPIVVGLYPAVALGSSANEAEAAQIALDNFVSNRASSGYGLHSLLTSSSASLMTVLIHSMPKNENAGILRAAITAISCGVAAQQVRKSVFT